MTQHSAPKAQPESSLDALPPEARQRLREYLQPPAAPPPTATLSPGMRRFVLAVDRGVLAVARHWLLTVNIMGGLFAGLPLLGPWLRSQGWHLPADAIYFAFRLTCHQMPERSFFIFGHKMCLCQRCMAIYVTVFGLGLLYGLVRGRIRPLNWRWMLVLWVPMALDGFTQLFGLRESTWELRLVTGALFALSCVWFGFPYLEQAFADMRRDLEARFARVAAREVASSQVAR
jgi:uncharacterized membrane protein